MYFRKVLSAIILFSVSVIYYSCDTVTSPTSTVSGKVYSYNYQPISNVKVTIGSKFGYTSFDGSFTINDVVFPFDVTVLDSLSRNVTIFKGLSLNNITLPLNRYVYNSSSATIHVTLPEKIVQANLKGKIIFTDENKINSYSEISQQSSQSYINVPIKQFTIGKLILLTYKKDSANLILSYENYGESPNISIQPNGTYFYTFDSLSIALNPGEQNVTGSFILPSGYFNSYSDFYLSFASNSFNLFSYYEFSRLRGNSFSFKIPTGLPRQFNVIVENSSNGNSGYSYESFFAYPDSPNNLEIKTSPFLISPENQIKDVSNNTQFSFNGGTGSGVYIIGLYNTSRNVDYKIVTSNINFTLEGLEDLGFGRINNNYFNWNVTKIGPVNSMNDYISNYFNTQNNFSSRSDERTFSTAP